LEEATSLNRAESNELLTRTLRGVSRSFYTTLRVLPAAVRPQIGLAYLLARTTDTIADTKALPANQRLEALQALRSRIQGSSKAPLKFDILSNSQASEEERVLLERVEDSLVLLQNLESFDRERIIGVLEIITSGQESDLTRFAHAGASNITALSTADELDDYTYQVAGCVGEFWTHLCRRHLFPKANLDEAQLLLRAVRFGKGLQLVNVLRDVPSDLRNGRCYIPAAQLQQAGLAPTDLLDPNVYPRFHPLYTAWLDKAHAHLVEGWRYTNMLPHRQMRVRLACAWPLLIGFKTMDLLRTNNVLDSTKRVKVPRQEVKRIILRSVLWYHWPAKWRGLAPMR
jgi:farnesyl-diphosphate farnesyltransferase